MKNQLLACGVLFSIFSAVQAANLTNNIQGVGPKNALINPYFCIQDSNSQVTYSLAPGQSVDANKFSGNAYYVGGSIRFGGCSTNNSYLGYLGLSINERHQNSISSYNPPQGIHIAYQNAAIDKNGVLTGNIKYTAIKPNYNFLSSTPSKNAIWDFVGINLSGLEFSKMIDPTVIPNLSQEDANQNVSDLNDTQSFINAGMNTIRIPISWGYTQLEGPGQGDLNSDYFASYVMPLLETLTNSRVNVILDLHAYMRYSIFGKEYSGCGSEGKCPDGTLVTDPKAYQDVWLKIYNLLRNDHHINLDYVMFDLINEPVGAPDDSVFTIQTSVIKTLRQNGFQGYILVEGNSWSGMHSWTTTTWNSSDGKKIYSNASLFTRDNFQKAGVNDLSKIVINAHQYLDIDYSGNNNQCVTNLDTTGSNGFNLKAFRDYLEQNHLKAMITEFGAGFDAQSCSVAMQKFLDYLKQNAAQDKDYGFIGWTIWSTGHGWGNYNLRVKPNSYQMNVIQNYLKPKN